MNHRLLTASLLLQYFPGREEIPPSGLYEENRADGFGQNSGRKRFPRKCLSRTKKNPTSVS
jgi:hypothetical protein